MPTVITEDFWSDTWSDTWPGDLLFVPDPIYTGTRVPRVSLKVNGQDIKAEGISFDSEEGYGFRSLQATITREVALRLNVVQGANVTLWTSAAENQWDGHLTGPPRFRTDGKADITANGWALRAEKNTDPLPYGTADALQFNDAKDDPFNFSADVRRIETDAKPAQLWFKIENGTAVNTGDHRSQAIWVPGGILTEIAFRKNFNVSSGADVLRIQTFPGPSGAGSATLGLDSPLNAGDGSTITRTGGTNDGLSVRLVVTSGRTPANNNRIELDRVRVYGRHPNGSGPTVASPTWTPSQVLADIGSILGVDTSGVHTSTLNILPMWEVEGNDWLTVMGEITDLEDSHFGFYERGRIVSGFWANSPIWYVRNGPGVDLTPNVIHSAVQVSYAWPSGKPRRAYAENAVAVAKYGLNVYEVELPDPQKETTLATAVVDALLPVVSSESYSGTIQTTEYRDASGAIRPFGPRPGHRVVIEDFGPGQSHTARITSTSGVQGEPLILGIEGAEANADRIILLHDLKEARKRGRKRHRKRKRKKKKN